MELPVVDRGEIEVTYAAAPGGWDSIPEAAQRAFAALEAASPPHGRKLYGYWHPPTLEYHACYERQPEDEPEAMGLCSGRLPGGPYFRQRLHGDDVISRIGPAWAALSGQTKV